jgi:hypothetical protein
LNAERTMAIMTMIFNKLNIPIAAHKTVGPVTCLEYLGIVLDTVKFEAIVLSAIAFGGSTVKKSSSKCRMFLIL